MNRCFQNLNCAVQHEASFISFVSSAKRACLRSSPPHSLVESALKIGFLESLSFSPAYFPPILEFFYNFHRSHYLLLSSCFLFFLFLSANFDLRIDRGFFKRSVPCIASLLSIFRFRSQDLHIGVGRSFA